MMRFFLLATLAASSFPIHAADPPAKRGGGLFGFSAPPGEQISAGLFPSANAPSAQGSEFVSSSQKVNSASPASETIFRTGQPQKVDSVSYVIENGRKVEKTVENTSVSQPVAVQVIDPADSDKKKKGGIFGFGKHNDADAENMVVTPVPMPAPNTQVPVVASPIASSHSPATVPSNPVASPIPAVIATETPDFEGMKKEKSGWGPFRSKKKSDPAVVTATTITATPVVASPVTAASDAPVAMNNKPTPTVATNTNTFEVPRNEAKKDNAKKDEKENHGGGILSPIANLRPPRKEIDFSSAETIIQDGEIVAGANTTFDAAPTATSTGPRQAPQVINGVKTYSSWGDVNARSSSAADRIIEKIR